MDKCFPLSRNYYDEATAFFKSAYTHKPKNNGYKNAHFEDKQSIEAEQSESESSTSSEDKKYTYFARQSFRTSRRTLSSRGDGFNTYMF